MRVLFNSRLAAIYFLCIWSAILALVALDSQQMRVLNKVIFVPTIRFWDSDDSPEYEHDGPPLAIAADVIFSDDNDAVRGNPVHPTVSRDPSTLPSREIGFDYLLNNSVAEVKETHPSAWCA